MSDKNINEMNDNLINSVNSHWEEILKNVQYNMGLSEISYKTWLLPLKVSSIKDNTFIITTTDSGIQLNHIKKNYEKSIREAICNYFQHEYDIVIKSSDEIQAESAIKSPIHKNNSSELNPVYTFENFISGPSNELAFAAALAVAEAPGEFYNPLFIYAGAGLGKTHLMYAIGNFIINKHPEKKVLYVTSETFTNELIRSIREGKSSPDETRNKYRNLDVLLIDDIQFIIGKESTQEEFFNTFNALREAKKQIVISSDKPPKDFTTLEDRLRSRFESGVVFDIQPPSYEVRMAILKKKLESLDIEFKEEVLSYIAENITTNIREMLGSLNKIVAIYKLQRLSKDDVTLEFTKNALKNIISTTNKRTIDVNYIAKIVSEHFGITLNDIYSKNRSQNVVFPRQIVMYLSTKLTSLSIMEIGKQLLKDHSTVIHGKDLIEKRMQDEKAIQDTIDILIKKINPQ